MLHLDNLHLIDDLLPEELREAMRTRTRERTMPNPSELERLDEVPTDRAAFIQENAVALVERLEAKIRRQAETIGKLEKTVRTLRAERFALHDEASALRLQLSDKHDWVVSALRDYRKLAALLHSLGLEQWEDTVAAVVDRVDCLCRRVKQQEEELEALCLQGEALQAELIAARREAMAEAAALLVTIRNLAIEAQHFASAKARHQLAGIVLLCDGWLDRARLDTSALTPDAGPR